MNVFLLCEPARTITYTIAIVDWFRLRFSPQNIEQKKQNTRRRNNGGDVQKSAASIRHEEWRIKTEKEKYTRYL